MKMLLILTVLIAALFSYGCVQGSVPLPRACTADAKICPDGSSVGRQGPNCEFAACPAPLPQVCSNETKTCLDGSIVGRQGLNCEFAACPQGCSKDAKICPDGSSVGRQGPNCEFAACPQMNYTPPANYSLYGKVTIAPLCPVEPCNRVFDYSVARVNVYDAASRDRVAQVSADSSGYYGVKLDPGSYLVNVTDASGNSFGLPSLDYTQSFSIEKGHMVQMDFDIDTGIR